MSSDDEIEFVSAVKASADVSSEVVLSSGDESDDGDLPSGPECLRRCKEFADVTGTNNALAMFYLQGTKWDLEVALTLFSILDIYRFLNSYCFFFKLFLEKS